MHHAKITLSLLLGNLLAVTADLTVPKSRPFAKPIKVEFSVDVATENDYIGIYNYDNGPLDESPFNEELQFFVYLCGSQERVTCAAVEDGSGSVTFNGVDPTEEYYDQWPLNPRKYKVCHMRQGTDADENETGELIQNCKKLTVKMGKKKKQKIEKKAYVRTVKNSYSVGEKIEVKFNSGFKSQNSWIGIYFDDGFDDDGGDELLWVYTGCNNVAGDQIEIDDKSNDCIKKRKKGKVTFDESNTGRSELDWPLPEGVYRLRLEYYNNSPWGLYKDAEETFKVVDQMN